MAAIISGQYYRRGGQTGELEIFDPTGSKRHPTTTCNHCSCIVVCRPLSPTPSYCPVCDKLVCPKCHAKGGCETWERQMDAMEAKDRLYRSVHG